MMEELPSPSIIAPLCLKRRMSIAKDEDHNEVPQPTLTLSSAPPLLTTLEAPVNGNREDQPLNFLPKKPKKSDEASSRCSCEDGSPADEVGTGVLGGISELVHVSDELSKVKVGNEILEGRSEFVGFESEEKNGILEGKGTITECSVLEDGVGIAEGEIFLQFEELGAPCDNFSEKQSIDFGLDKKTENTMKSDPKVGECIKLKGEVCFCKDCSEKQCVKLESEKVNENSEGTEAKIDSCRSCSEKLIGNFEGLLPRLVKSHGGNLKSDASAYTLEIEVVDGTALVDVRKIDGKKKKKGRRKGLGIATGVSAAEAFNGARKEFVYSRKEMEALRFVNVKGQNRFWQKIYYGFAQIVRKEYDELGTVRHQKQGDHQQATRMKNYYGQGILGESTPENARGETETTSPLDFACDGDNWGKDDDDLVGEWSGQEDSDDEYESIQRPAFWVEGEPDFESGPPEDGLEYLRRVRWEAAQIPKVKVAKIDNGKLNKEQSVYMPSIPDMEKCPPHLVPLQQWKDEFIADFSELRLALSRLENTCDTEPQSIFFCHKEDSRRSSEGLSLLELSSGGPTLSAVLAMDPVTRVAILKRRISLFDSASEVSKDDCAWLYALSAVVDTPLDADTCASLRCLLRRCAKLRAAKSELDDEVIMLNILTTISGKFYGQSEI